MPVSSTQIYLFFLLNAINSVNTLLEAGSCGTYVLADSKLSGLSEIIQPKVNGEILNIERHENFARQILESLYSDKSLN